MRAYLLADLIRRLAELRRGRATVCWPPDAADGQRRDAVALNIHPPDRHPQPSEVTGPAVELLSRLLDAGYAEVTGDGAVSVTAGSRQGTQWTSWTLWRPSESGGPAPWGRGVPDPHVLGVAAALRRLGAIEVLVAPRSCRERVDELARVAAGPQAVRHWLDAPEVTFTGRPLPDVSELAEHGLDPLALRLALLRQDHRAPARLDWDTLAVADRALRDWRARVAVWAESPSRPMCAGHVSEVTDALDAELDTARALAALDRLAEDAEIPPGSKFEAAAHLDRLLGLDLARQVGQPPAAAPPPSS